MWGDRQVPAELAAFPGYLMARLGHDAATRFREALEPQGFHPRDFGVMNIVAAAPGITQQQLHTRTGIDTSSMVAVIDKLEGLGLAERRPHPDDRRVRAIHLTPAGLEALQLARRTARELQHVVFAALRPDEQETLHRLLTKLAAANLPSGGPASDNPRPSSACPDPPTV